MSTIQVVGAIFIDGTKVLAFRRKAGKSAAGKWEFPGGKVEPNESPEHALARELEEELGLTNVTVGECLDRSTTPVGDVSIDLACYEVDTHIFPTSSSDHDMIQWVERESLSSLDWAEPDLPSVHKLMNVTGGSHG